MRRSARSQMKKSIAQEERGMAQLGGVRHRGSGAAWSRKADGRVNGDRRGGLDHLLVEYKRTDNEKQITLKKADLAKVESEAALSCRIPILGFELGGDDYIVLTGADFREMRDALSRLDG